MAVIDVQTGGWAYESEDRDALAASRRIIPYEAIPEATLPETIGRAAFVYVEDQSNQGSCQGNALSTGIECCRTVHGGTLSQLSRQAAYVLSQKIDGISGDRGSTISAGIKLAMGDGICLESVWPYPSSYSARVPAGYAAAAKYRIAGHSAVTSYDELLRHLTLGTIHIGVMWSSGVDRGVANNGAVLESWPAGGAGGHSIEAVGYRVTDYMGEPLPGDQPYCEWVNSWSKRWGYDGRFLTSPRATEQMRTSKWAVFEAMFGATSPPIKLPDYGSLT